MKYNEKSLSKPRRVAISSYVSQNIVGNNNMHFRKLKKEQIKTPHILKMSNTCKLGMCYRKVKSSSLKIYSRLAKKRKHSQ